MSRVLMLDVDGVLLSAAPSWDNDLEADLGIARADLQGAFFARYWPKIIIGEAEIAPCLEAALAAIGAGVGAEDFMAYWFARDARIDAQVLEDARGLRAAGWRVFLATNQEHRRAAYLMETLGLGADVDGIVYSAALGAKKPGPAFFRAAGQITGAGAAAHVLVDDTLANVEGARNCGWAAAHWAPGARLRDLAAGS